MTTLLILRRAARTLWIKSLKIIRRVCRYGSPFSVAIKAQGDILVLDEVLAVGDEAFQRKCANFFEKVKNDPTKNGHFSDT